jgi:dTMP kinase
MRGAGEANEGLFVVLEGIDGSGTTTQAARWAAHLRAQRRLVHVTHEPSSGPVGTQIRLVLRQRLTFPATHQAEVMALLFAADRLDHVASEVEPLLRDGYVVISDRYDLSSLAYQSITAAPANPEGPPSSQAAGAAATTSRWCSTSPPTWRPRGGGSGAAPRRSSTMQICKPGWPRPTAAPRIWCPATA